MIPPLTNYNCFNGPDHTVMHPDNIPNNNIGISYAPIPGNEQEYKKSVISKQEAIDIIDMSENKNLGEYLTDLEKSKIEMEKTIKNHKKTKSNNRK